jgi:hypothetical protein
MLDPATREGMRDLQVLPERPWKTRPVCGMRSKGSDVTERTYAQYRGTVLLDGNRLSGTLTITRGRLILEADDSRVNRLVRM